jgi:hypothetical protein
MTTAKRYWQAAQAVNLPATGRNYRRRVRGLWALVQIAKLPRDSRIRRLAIKLLASQGYIVMAEVPARQRA